MRFLPLLLASHSALAIPLVTITPIVAAPNSLPINSFSAASYQLKNNAPSLSKFSMQAIAGVTQITTAADACTNPITLTANQSCTLYLHIQANQLPETLHQGPIICNANSATTACAQPSPDQAMNISVQKTAIAQNNWIEILVAQEEPPDDLTGYMNKVIQLAPSLQQLHLRIPAGNTNNIKYQNLINVLRAAYPNPLEVGYHPDNSSGSESAWGCSVGDWQCVLNASIINMNAINTLVDPKHQGLGFNIFSIEQSYLEPPDGPSLHQIKACLNAPMASSGATCPAGISTVPAPYVKFGDVLPSYGGCDETQPELQCEYGSGALDYGYPQYYNLGKRLPSIYSSLVSSGQYFPSFSASACIAGASYPYMVVDADNVNAYAAPKIPCTSATPNVYNYSNPPNINLVTTYLAYLLTQYPPISNLPYVAGATIYLSFSGEDDFLGSPGWTLSDLSDFYNGLYSEFNYLNTYDNGAYSASLFPLGYNSVNQIHYGIWSFSSIINQN